jgi:hypothetical protein
MPFNGNPVVLSSHAQPPPKVAVYGSSCSYRRGLKILKLVNLAALRKVKSARKCRHALFAASLLTLVCVGLAHFKRTKVTDLDFGKIVVVTESIPMCDEGGCKRCFRFMKDIDEYFSSRIARPMLWLLNRNPHRFLTLQPRLLRRGWNILGPRNYTKSFSSINGPGYGTSPQSFVFRSPNRNTIAVAFMFLWSYKVALSGDPFLTIPEIYLESLSNRTPAWCLVTVSDDIQHIRASVELNLSISAIDRLRLREIDIYSKSDVVLFSTKEDRAKARSMLKHHPRPAMIVWQYSPSFVTTSASHTVESFSNTLIRGNTTRIAFVGPAHQSNVKAVKWLTERVLVLFAGKPFNVCLMIIGNGWSTSVVAAGNVCVEFVGYVGNLRQHLSKAVALVVPSSVASGVTTKVFLGAEHNIPVITTSLGARGHNVVSKQFLAGFFCLNSVPVLVRDAVEEFASGIEYLRLADLDRTSTLS